MRTVTEELLLLVRRDLEGRHPYYVHVTGKGAYLLCKEPWSEGEWGLQVVSHIPLWQHYLCPSCAQLVKERAAQVEQLRQEAERALRVKRLAVTGQGS